MYGRRFCKAAPAHILGSRRHRCLSSKVHEPLHILFCGSDQFSVTSLQALESERKASNGLIASIDVVCRPPKLTRRYLKTLREVPIATAARNLRLPLHEIDTFTGWTPPISPNLIVTVSFGLLIPSRIVLHAKYGGLNVHPSLLPELPGPAPLHHTLLEGRKTTGVTLQTLHPTQFDKGKIIAQTPYPGIEHDAESVEQLRDLTAPLGAELLVSSLRNGLFVAPVQETGWYRGDQSLTRFKKASKIGPEDRHIDWASWSADEILRRQRVIGPLWNFAESLVQDKSGERRGTRRLIWEHGFRLPQEEFHLFPAIGQPIVVGLSKTTKKVYVRTCDGQVLVPNHIKIEGGATTAAFHAIKARGLAPIPSTVNESQHPAHDFVTFHSRLS
ncbi:MAG: hypothetical protein Q9228_000680 [Teloschistes exilis]